MSLAATATATAATAVAPTPEGPVVVDGKPISRGALRHWAEGREACSGRSDPAAGYRAFLHDTGQTTGNVRSRVWLDLQSDRLREQAIADIDDPTAQQEALDRFVSAFRRRWKARTVCRAPWVDEVDCGRVVGQGQARSSAVTIRSA